MRRLAIVVVLLAGCRTRAVTTHYAGAPVAACAAGRPYQAPAINSPTQPFIPLVAAAPPPAAHEPEPVEGPPPGNVDAAADPDADSTAKKTKKKPAKKAKKKKADKKEAP